MNLTENIIDLSEKRDNKIKQEPKVNLNKFKSFFGIAGKMIQQKTINNTFSFSKLKKDVTSNSPYADIQDLNSTTQKNEQIPQFEYQQEHIPNKKFEQSDIQIKDYKLNGNQSQTQRIPLKKIFNEQKQQQKENNSQDKQMNRKQNNQLIQQTQTTQQQTFDSADQTTNLQNINKRQFIMQRMEEEKAQKERIAKQQQEANKLIKQIQERIKQKESLLKQKEEAIILTELEKRKAVMTQRRELSQPIRLNDLTEHQKKYEEDKKVKEYEREHLKQEHDFKIRQNTLKFPKSQTQMRIEEEEKYLKQLKEQDIKLKQIARQRQFKYANFAQENYFREHPIKQKQSPPKKEVQQKQIQEISITEQNLRKIRRYIPQIPQQHHLSQESKDSINDLSIHLENKPPKPIKKKNYFNSEKTHKTPELPAKPKTIDYLQQLRQQRKMQNMTVDQLDKSTEYILQENQKDIQQILENVQKLEQKAKDREKTALLKNDIQMEEEANNLYIATIRAKLAILDKN
ncbi:unnamed protein product (macronuclear) [Paramecium tetraurelia]|uniref:Uncharacterized protein n=1 Tax=Paramecium tetraurelia TaxID=5888 RepID=A0CN62_PARTE|nr:uncharacterized protein GSPATT00008670001 [Paramecium tetraurelia]CAK72229.1 unnamed protein product [Paramecium tetraurelia]|eukprot:XP_001439626.1 hypothetical protein (macronuclear) [Paramecium tetraurelia strain d4-2]